MSSEAEPGRAEARSDLVSVIVCTYNRADKLRECLMRLLAMRIPETVDWELICVDNNSTDSTRDVVEELAKASGSRLKYLFEAKQGSSRARNAGISASRGEVIAITDDDCLVDSNWLAAIWQEFRADPTLDLVGGRVELHDRADLPITIQLSRSRARFDALSGFNRLPSCNLAFRRRVMAAVGLFDLDFGPGTPIGAAEDLEFVYRACRAGFAAAYSPDVLLFHAHGRRTEVERNKLERTYVVARGAFYLRQILRGDVLAMRLASWEMIGLLRDLFGKPWKGQSIKREVRFLAYLSQGAGLYLRIRIGKLLTAPAR